MKFVGVDLGWYGKLSGVALLSLYRDQLHLAKLGTVGDHCAVLEWIDSVCGSRPAVIAVDAPLIVRNETGIRDAERQVGQLYGEFGASCHASNLTRPFVTKTIAFERALREWYWGRQRNHVLGDCKGGYIIVPAPNLATVVREKIGRTKEDGGTYCSFEAGGRVLPLRFRRPPAMAEGNNL